MQSCGTELLPKNTYLKQSSAGMKLPLTCCKSYAAAHAGCLNLGSEHTFGTEEKRNMSVRWGANRHNANQRQANKSCGISKGL